MYVGNRCVLVDVEPIRVPIHDTPVAASPGRSIRGLHGRPNVPLAARAMREAAAMAMPWDGTGHDALGTLRLAQGEGGRTHGHGIGRLCQSQVAPHDMCAGFSCPPPGPSVAPEAQPGSSKAPSRSSIASETDGFTCNLFSYIMYLASSGRPRPPPRSLGAWLAWQLAHYNIQRRQDGDLRSSSSTLLLPFG